MKYYVIRNKDNHDEFWSNEFGWLEGPIYGMGSNIDLFSEDEKMQYNLPVGGGWVLAEEDDKDSKYQWFNLVGNPINGFRLLGPFASHEDAVEWQEGCDESCWVIESESEGLYQLNQSECVYGVQSVHFSLDKHRTYSRIKQKENRIDK